MAREAKDIQKAVDIYIMGREYRVSCPEAEVESLIQASQYLDFKMREIREQGKVIGAERIAVMAALNMAFEVQSRSPAAAAVDTDHVQRRIEAMEARIDEALRQQTGLFDLPPS